MPAPLTKKITLSDLRAVRTTGQKMAMLTCYDFTTARMMQEAGVPILLVGDSASSVVLGYPSTLPVPLSFMTEITRAVRAGAPLALLIGDMPFGSYGASVTQGIRNVTQMVKQTQCDMVKLEVSAGHARLVRRLADIGVAVVAHLGLKPQSVALTGGYRFQGRTAEEAYNILALALQMEEAGAAAILLEAVPPDVANAVVEQSTVPIIGCGAGPACHSCVIVTQDGLGLTPHRPRFVPTLAEMAEPLRLAFATFVDQVANGQYPLPEHDYVMPPAEKARFEQRNRKDLQPPV